MPLIYLYLAQSNRSFIEKIMVSSLKDQIDEYRQVSSMKELVEAIAETPDNFILLDLPKGHSYEELSEQIEAVELGSRIKLLNTTLIKHIETFSQSPTSIVERAIENALKRVACSNFLIDLEEQTIYLEYSNWSVKEMLNFNRNIEHLTFKVKDMKQCSNMVILKADISNLKSKYKENELEFIAQSLIGK